MANKVWKDAASVEADMRHLLELVAGTDIAQLEVEHEGIRFRIQREPGRTGSFSSVRASTTETAFEAAEAAVDSRHVVSSPWVGVFYASVAVGDEVGIGQSIGDVEALGMRHPIEAEITGRVEEILVADGHAVEYGQGLVRLESSLAGA